MKLYGLYSEKQECLMGFSTESNSGGDCCVPVGFSLSSWDNKYEPLWCTTDKDRAEFVATHRSTSWYNADWSSPGWDEEWYGKTFKVVELNSYKETKEK